MRLESGPAAYDRNFNLGYLVICIGLCAWFYYDYSSGWVNKNIDKARVVLTQRFGADAIPAEFPPAPTEAEFKALLAAKPTDAAQVREALGQPQILQEDPANPGEIFEHYISRYGMAQVPVRTGRVDLVRMNWTTWYKSKEEIGAQIYYAAFCGLVGLYVLYRVFRAATLRVVIDDEGMTYGSQRIPADNMKRLVDWNRKGWVDLYYGAGGGERKLRIDNQKVRKYDEIIDALCELKGFPDPRPAAEPEDAFPDDAAPETDQDEPAGARNDADDKS